MFAPLFVCAELVAALTGAEVPAETTGGVATVAPLSSRLLHERGRSYLLNSANLSVLLLSPARSYLYDGEQLVTVSQQQGFAPVEDRSA